MRKKVKRGYNQSEIIARGVQEALGDGTVLLPNLLKRKSFTSTQTAKDRMDRWGNVKDAFMPNLRCRPFPLQGSHILLLDDVLTTGATLEACASILVEELGCRVSIATLAYVE